MTIRSLIPTGSMLYYPNSEKIMRDIIVTKLKFNEVTIGVKVLNEDLMTWVIDCDGMITEYVLHRNVGGATVGISTMRKLGIKTSAAIIGHAFMSVSEQIKRKEVLEGSEYIAGIKLIKDSGSNVK